MSSPRRIVLGITGSIAAFKAAALASELTKLGLEVRAVMTDGACHFIAPLTLEALTGYPAETSIWDERPGSSRMGHIELAQWADVLLIAPASASAIARLALGLADDLLGAVALASEAPLLIAPAMESAMYLHPATRNHIATLQGRGAVFVGPVVGRLASGAEGAGRMVEPNTIVAAVMDALAATGELAGTSVLVTAGPTQEPIDPVRFIGNHSSGKMGYAIAEEAARRGADVLLVSGPTVLADPPRVRVIRVTTTSEMATAVRDNLAGRDITVMAAAVADFRPDRVEDHKVKRSGEMILHLVPTIDVAAETSRLAPGAIHVGFALETGNLVENARRKLAAKRQQLVVANAVSPDHNPFGADENRVWFITLDREEELPLMSKQDVAARLWDRISEMRKA